jgi:hypothetical protein
MLDPVVAGVKLMVKSGAAPTTRVAVVVCVFPPPAPVIVNVVDPVGVPREFTADVPPILCTDASFAVVAMASDAVKPVSAAVTAPNVAVAPDGSPDADKLTFEPPPFIDVMLTVYCAVPPGATETDAGVTARLKSATGALLAATAGL